jgi:hypothetical protein
MDDLGPVGPGRRLAAELRCFRQEAGLTQEQVAGTLEWSTSKISRIETASSLRY